MTVSHPPPHAGHAVPLPSGQCMDSPPRVWVFLGPRKGDNRQLLFLE